MNNDLLVDTNILVYAIDEDSQFHATSRSVLQKYALIESFIPQHFHTLHSTL